MKKNIVGRKYTKRYTLKSVVYHWLNSMLDEDYVKALEDWLIRLKRYESFKRGIFLGIEIKSYRHFYFLFAGHGCNTF